MVNLTKSQKFIVVLTVLWEFFLLANCTKRSYVRWDDFFALSLPFILYWSGVWIFGFGYIFNMLKKIKLVSFMKWCASFFYVLSKSLLKTGGYALIVIFVFGVIVHSIKSLKSFSDSDDFMDSAASEIIYDYGKYYGLFIWQDNFCFERGVKLTNLDIIRKKYKTEIEHLESRWKNIKDKKGRSVEDVFIKTGKLDKIASVKGYEGFKYLRKVIIIEELEKQNSNEVFKYFKNLSKDDILYEYGNLVTEKQACEYFNQILPEMMQDDGNPFSQMMKFLDKYSFNFVPDKN